MTGLDHLGPDSLVSVDIGGVLYTDRVKNLQQPRTDDCFAAVTNSLAAFFAALTASNPNWTDLLHEHVGGVDL